MTVRDMKELSQLNNNELPDFNYLKWFNFKLLSTGNGNAVDVLRRSLLATIQDCRSSETTENSCTTDESHDRSPVK